MDKWDKREKVDGWTNLECNCKTRIECPCCHECIHGKIIPGKQGCLNCGYGLIAGYELPNGRTI